MLQVKASGLNIGFDVSPLIQKASSVLNTGGVERTSYNKNFKMQLCVKIRPI